ncbi:MAG: sulfotransferase [Myxococcales bacterium]|nr:sulfotransferase [Myxococcales bacterium]
MGADLAAVRERVARLRAGLPAIDVASAARDVVVIASSSRGGSSIFAEVLRRSTSLLHFRAEVNPQLRLYGCEGDDDDSVPAAHPVPPGLGLALGADCGRPTDTLEDDDAVEAFAREIAARLVLQWPELPVELDRVLADVRACVVPGPFGDPQDVYTRLFTRLAANWPSFHPGAYDLDRRRMAGLGPSSHFVPSAPVEEPPYVLPLPWRHASHAELATQPLIIKTPSNVYRLPWLRRLFPNARVRILHLTRNAAASINGLYDGWRFSGFHSHEVGSLEIGGYSDTTPGGDRWWKFDRPPGWRAYTRAPLEQVCAYQWTSAHRAVLAEAATDSFHLRFEDVLGSRQRQEEAMGRLSDWLGVRVHDELAGVLARGLPLVMATEQPRHRRWFARVEMLGPVCAQPEVRAVLDALGYVGDPTGWE